MAYVLYRKKIAYVPEHQTTFKHSGLLHILFASERDQDTNHSVTYLDIPK